VSRSVSAGRERLLAAAIDAFAERGYDAASIADIAERAGVVKSVTYHHFASKADLYEAVLASETDGLLRLVAEALPDEIEDIREATRRLVDAYLGFVESRPDAWRLMVRDAPVDPHLIAVHQRFRRRRAEALLAFFPAIPPEETAKNLYADLLGLALRIFASWWLDNREVPRTVLVDATMDFAAATAERLGVAASNGAEEGILTNRSRTTSHHAPMTRGLRADREQEGDGAFESKDAAPRQDP